MLLAADLDFMQLIIYAAVLVAGLLGALLQKRERNKQERGDEPRPPPRARPIPRGGRSEPQEPILIPPREPRPVPPPPQRDRLEGDILRVPRPVPAQPARVPRPQPVAQRTGPSRVAPVRAGRVAAPEPPPSLQAHARIGPEAAAAEPVQATAPVRRSIPVGGLARALLARRDGAAAALVVSEILAPPVSLRQNDPTRLI
jgi:hypothetical protein